MKRLTAVILTRNEAKHITTCIATLLPWADAVVVWDSGSTDATCDLAHLAGALVVQRPFDDYARQRQAALNTIASEWILFVDADERATPELAAEVGRVIQEPDIAGYWIPRRNFIVGHEMRGGGFTPDYQLRLLRSAKAHYDLTREVHEIVQLDGAEGYLSQPLIHLNYVDWAQFHRKQIGYARYEAHILAQRGIRPQAHNFVLQPLREFYRRFISLAGWRDGLHGLRLALLLAWYYGFVPYWHLLKKGEGVR
ncbi:MAG: glycosyltransferase family 2 protein [Caldilineaceae bacterium]|nr:glycosyltransferase family 2 protein [Caldilineaceae bacterium]